MRDGRYREALDYLAARQPGDFAPAVPLPPKPFETELFVQLPGCLPVVRAEDPAWLRAHLVGRMDPLVDHLANAAHFHRRPREDLIVHFADPPHFDRALTAKALLDVVDGLHRLPEGRNWLQAHPEFVRSIKASASSRSLAQGGGYVSPTSTESEWKTLAERLESLFPAPATQ